MTLLIQRSEHRDTQAIQAKLDELLRVQDGARTDLTKIDDQQPEQIELIGIKLGRKTSRETTSK
jgi:low affinity Fe/Cu permease